MSKFEKVWFQYQIEDQNALFKGIEGLFMLNVLVLAFINVYWKLNSVLKTNCTILKYKNIIKSKEIIIIM